MISDQKTIFSRAEEFGSDTALINSKGMSLTYNQLIKIAATVRQNIAGRPLVLLVCENDIYSVASYFSLIYHQIPVMLLHSSITSTFLNSIIERFRPGYIFAPRGNQVLSTDSAPREEIGNYQLKRLTGETLPTHSELALLLTTSGSTGSTKFVRLSYNNLWSNTRDIVTRLGISNTERTITTMPMSYTYGLSIINTHLFCGGSLVADELSIVSKPFFNALNEYEVTSFGGVPFTYETLLKLKFWRSLPASVKSLTQAGGKLKHPVFTELVNRCKELDVRFFSMYGQTEATARMAILDHQYAESKTGSIGLPVGEGRFLLLDENEQAIITPGKQGTLYYLGDNVSMGYANSWQDLNKGDENRGTINTGDIAYFDEEGFYYVVGREKRFVKVHGHRVSLDEIESILSTMGLESAVLGEDDAIKIYAQPKSVANEVLKQLAKTTKIPSRVFTYKEQEFIPRLKSGKVDYKTLAQLN